MNKFLSIYTFIGGLLMSTSGVIVAYYILFRGELSLSQLWAAAFIFLFGFVLLTSRDEDK